MSENKKKKAAEDLPAASGHPDAQAGKKESLFKDGEQFIVIPFNRLHGASAGELETGSNANSQEEQL